MFGFLTDSLPVVAIAVVIYIGHTADPFSPEKLSLFSRGVQDMAATVWSFGAEAPIVTNDVSGDESYWETEPPGSFWETEPPAKGTPPGVPSAERQPKKGDAFSWSALWKDSLLVQVFAGMAVGLVLNTLGHYFGLAPEYDEAGTTAGEGNQPARPSYWRRVLRRIKASLSLSRFAQ